MTDPLRDRRPGRPPARPSSPSRPTAVPRARQGRQEPRLPPAVPLPRPLRRTRPRQEIRIRQAEASDSVPCTTISTTYTTSHVWQLDSRADGEEIRVAFRLVRLPRELTLAAEQRPPAAPSRRGTLWLVAEQVDADAGGARNSRTRGREPERERPPEPERERPATPGSGHERPDSGYDPSWGPALRPSRGASAMQLSLPPAGRGASAVVGYAGAFHATGDACAYVQSLAVDPSHRRQGIATALLAAARRWATERGAERLIADVAARNYPALRLLQRTGFAFCGFNDRCYPKDEVAVFLSVELR